MSTRRRQGGLVFPIVLVFFGLMFLLINLGIVDRAIWGQIIRFWPVLLILSGIDTLLRRSSAGAAFGTMISTVILVVAGIAMFQLFAPQSWITETHAFSHSLDGASAAEVVLSCSDCSMDIAANSSSNNLISGQLTLRRDERLTESVRRDGDTAHFQLESEYWLPFLPIAGRESHVWQAGLTDSIPLALSVQTQGPVDLDLTGLQLTSVDVSTGDERCQITLSQLSTTLYLSGGQIEILVPQNVGLRVSGSASIELALPSTYIRSASEIVSPNYETAAIRTEVVLRPGAEWVEIKTLDADPIP